MKTTMPRSTRAVLLFVSITLGACWDHQAPTESPSSPEALLSAAVSDEQPLGTPGVPFMDISLEVRGSLRPGVPIEFIIRGKANVAVEDASIQVVLPVVAAAERSSWQAILLPTDDQEVQPQARWLRRFSRGDTFEERFSLVIPEPGYYEVIASATLAKQFVDGRWIDNAIPQRAWIWVDHANGKVTETFDFSVLPPDATSTSGPLTRTGEPFRLRMGSEDSPVCMPEFGWLCGSPWWQIGYHAEGGSYTPVRGAEVHWRFTYTSGEVVSNQTTTQETGRFEIPGCDGVAHARIEVRSDHPQVTVLNYVNPPNPSQRAAILLYEGPCVRRYFDAQAPAAAHLFENLKRTIEAHDGLGLHRHARVVATYDNRETRSGYHWISSGNVRSMFHAHINIIPTHVWRERGAFVAAHEWGHMWQDLDGGGLRRFYQHPNGQNRGCAESHFQYVATHMECAFAEAFASYYAVLTRGTATGEEYDLMRTNHFYFNRHEGGTDGSRIEGAIAGFLFDLTDSFSGDESWDAVHMSPVELFHVIRSCRVIPEGGHHFEAFLGVDHLIFCLERNRSFSSGGPYSFEMNGSVRSFFTSRSPRASSTMATGHVNASVEQLRRLWLVTLYRKQSGVGTNPNFSLNEPPGNPPSGISPPPPGGSPPPPGCSPPPPGGSQPPPGGSGPPPQYPVCEPVRGEA